MPDFEFHTWWLIGLTMLTIYGGLSRGFDRRRTIDAENTLASTTNAAITHHMNSIKRELTDCQQIIARQDKLIAVLWNSSFGTDYDNYGVGPPRKLSTIHGVRPQWYLRNCPLEGTELVKEKHS